MRAAISHVNSFLPDRIVDNDEIESLVNRRRMTLPPNSIERLFGARQRRYAEPHQQTSDLAAAAALPIVEEVGKEKIDCLIFASACNDLLEPATANIVQQKLDLHCPVFDIKNACNSFVNGLQTASAMILSGFYRNVLICCGEKLQDSIKFNLDDDEEISKRIASLTFGDAGAAMLITSSNNGRGIYDQRFKSNGKFWKLCTIPGGGSMFPHDVTKNYFEGFTTELRHELVRESKGVVDEVLAASGWKRDDIRHVFTHQVSNQTFQVIAETSGMPLEKFHNVFPCYGNTAAASIPLSIHQAHREGKLRDGDKIMLIGLAAGISVSIQLIIW
jgi:acyl-CoA:acyl-CoA alkyltransferase